MDKFPQSMKNLKAMQATDLTDHAFDEMLKITGMEDN